MSSNSNVFERNAEISKNASSRRSRVVVFLLAFFFPVGLHNYYLGYHIKGIVQTFTAIALILFIPPFLLVFILPLYITWITSEGLIYLLWYDVKDGEDFLMYDKNNPPRPDYKKALLLSFILPFGLHNIYLGNIKRGIIEWSFVAIVLTTYLIFQIIPIMFISLYAIIIIIIISWLEGIWMIIKK